MRLWRNGGPRNCLQFWGVSGRRAGFIANEVLPSGAQRHLSKTETAICEEVSRKAKNAKHMFWTKGQNNFRSICSNWNRATKTENLKSSHNMRLWRNGRRAGFRFQWETVEVQVLSAAPK